MPSVIIPAHNESMVIDRCLRAIHQSNNREYSELEIIVICNGCTDDTANRARKYNGVTVIEIEEASKILALNEGDSRANSFPRVYLDADIEISFNDLKLAILGIQDSEYLAVSPKAHFIIENSDFWVKCFYSIWTKMSYFSRGKMIGSGIYILSKDGRSRFTTFPNLVSDDGYIRTLFNDSEKQTLENCTFNVFVPRNLKDLIKIKRRSFWGNRQLALHYQDSNIVQENTIKDILFLVFYKPWLIPAAFVYILIQLRIRTVRSINLKNNSCFVWERDNSSRS